MAVLLFRLRGVPDDEADDVRALLTQHAIDFYETTSGSWGVSMPAIWLHDDSSIDQAKELLAVYQEQRARAARDAYVALKQRGEHKRLWQGIAAHPFRFLLMLALIAFMLYVSLSPFIHFG
ncbi:DUF6164 family protein [Mariprofundus ferrooxydans]|nr:DUF6164 family protein [Mariprofundus ferrooxydans]KON48740.1 hypothetical protein AL013_01870 [Mariprofundus ferrooxydans]